MPSYVGKIENFWNSDLNSHVFVNTYCLGDTRNYHHQNFKSEVSMASQSFNDELPPCWKKFLEVFKLQQGVVSWTLIEPGRIVPIHQDKFIVLRKTLNAALTNCIRYTMMLDDWSFGQSMEFENHVLRDWSAGDTWAFDHSEYHWAANASNKNFYSCQISFINPHENTINRK